MPLVVGEAMAMEKPVAATDAGGVRELLGESGVIVPAGNPARLAEAMLGLMQLSDEQRRAVGRAARQRILERFSIEAIADRWEELYLRLLGLNA
jgi:glycosyltransferase involved in cell wall biosynthesis